MNIQGLQKLTLLDYPGQVACTIFTAGCNFCCPFCHNAALVTQTDNRTFLSDSELFRFLKKRQGILDGVCITGGEPLMQSDIEHFTDKLKNLGYTVKLDTNGSFPLKLKHLAEHGLIDYVAMDIKNTAEKYSKTIGAAALDISAIQQSISYLMTKAVPFEFRTTVVAEYHSMEDFETIGRWLQGTESYYLQAFRDTGDLILPNLHGYTPEEMKQAADIVKTYIPNVMIRGI